MAASVQVVPPTMAHAVELAHVMREADAAEVLASGSSTPFEAVLESLRVSELAGTLLINGQVAAMFGLARGGNETLLTGPDVGVAWALTGKPVERHPKLFASLSRKVVTSFLRRADCLFNLVDARYTAALRWASWLGFEVLPAVPVGPRDMPFHPIVLRRAHV